MIKFVHVMNHLRISLLLTLTLLMGAGTFAQVSFTAKASQKVVGAEDVLEISFTLDGVSGVDNFVPPSFSPFQIAGGPSTTSGFNLINGNASKYYSVSYYLKPSGTGKFTIGSATVTVNNQTLHSNTVSLEVVKGSTGSSAASPQNPFQSMMGGFPNMPNMPDPMGGMSPSDYGDEYLRKGESADEKIKKNMLVKMSVTRNTCYVGEPIVATCKLYTRLPSQSKVVERPSFSGFSVFEMTPPEQGNASREVVGGKPYNGFLIRKAQLYPLQSGDLTIEPVELDNSVTFYRQGKAPKTQAPAGSVFDQMMKDFWGDGDVNAVPEKHNLNLTTEPVVIHVKPLPEAGKPADFSGAVGQFSIQSSLSSTTLKTNETDTLTLVVTGTGNLPMINAPILHVPSGLESYDPSAKEQLDQTVSPIKGRKVFSYVFTAGSAGSYSIPAINLSYFDPQTTSYKTVSADPLLIKVLPGPQRAQPGVEATGESVSRKPWIWEVLGGIILIGLALWIGIRKAKRKEVKVVTQAPTPKDTPSPYAPQALWDTKVQQMAPAAVTTFEEKDWLEDAREKLKNGNTAEYYRSLNAGIWGFLQDRLALSGERNKNKVLELMEEKGFSPFVREETRQLLDECELALYAPVQNHTDMQQAMELAERLQKRFVYDLKV
jgi:hypothetical protein